ncbi:glycerophosphoryl diester phosphodiesterase membrane domain-containing protein [Kineococcus sp. SYSU DK003]|uniref:glycerophosphoryl diester phosphodiesterase membrane domain-containing protein n=1 Tax=Kineococcus sp. SYSU DK003 TaxID=3383124 RepID=UPI003D7D0987
MGTEQWQRPDDGADRENLGAAPGRAPGAGWGTPDVPGGPGGPGGWSCPAPPPAPDAQPAWGAAPGGPSRPSAPRPGIVPLRPLGLGEIWDGAFRAFRQNPRVMVGLSAIVVVITSFVSLVASYVTTSDLMGAVNRLEAGGGSVEDLFSSLQRSVPLWVFSTVLQSVAVLVLNGMLIVSVSRAVLGRTIGFGELWATCRSRILPLIGLSLIITFATLAVGVVTLGPGILLVVFSGSDLVTGLGVVALLLGLLGWLAGGAFLWVRWSMATPAMLLENLGVGASLKRSSGLTRRSFWRTFGILLLTAIVVYVVVMAVAVPFTGLGAVLGQGFGTADAGVGLAASQTVSTLGSVVGSIVGYPFLASVTALLYVDLRMRREGLDVELHRAVGP